MYQRYRPILTIFISCQFLFYVLFIITYYGLLSASHLWPSKSCSHVVRSVRVMLCLFERIKIEFGGT